MFGGAGSQLRTRLRRGIPCSGSIYREIDALGADYGPFTQAFPGISPKSDRPRPKRRTGKASARTGSDFLGNSEPPWRRWQMLMAAFDPLQTLAPRRISAQTRRTRCVPFRPGHSDMSGCYALGTIVMDLRPTLRFALLGCPTTVECRDMRHWRAARRPACGQETGLDRSTFRRRHRCATAYGH